VLQHGKTWWFLMIAMNSGAFGVKKFGGVKYAG
jgi:hypothetical protein